MPGTDFFSCLLKYTARRTRHDTDRETAQWELSKTFIAKFQNTFKTSSKLQDSFPRSSYGSFYMHTIWTLRIEVVFYFQHPLFGPLIFLWISLFAIDLLTIMKFPNFPSPKSHSSPNLSDLVKSTSVVCVFFSPNFVQRLYTAETLVYTLEPKQRQTACGLYCWQAKANTMWMVPSCRPWYKKTSLTPEQLCAYIITIQWSRCL